MTLAASKINRSEKIALHVGEAAAMSGLGRSSLYKLFDSGRLTTVKIGGRRLVLRESLEELLGTRSARKAEASEVEAS